MSLESELATDAARRRILSALQHQLVNAVMGNEKVAREFGLSLTDLQTLHLMTIDRSVRTPSALAQASGLPTSTVTRVLDRLESAGYITRIADPIDRRRTQLQLVDQKVAEITAAYQGRETGALTDGFSDDELDAIARFLERASTFF